METLREKLTFILTALAYLLFHLGMAPGSGSIVTGTIMALLHTLPYEIGFTYIVVVFIRRTSGNRWPPWNRVARIFFTIGIIVGLMYNLYGIGAREQRRLKQLKKTPATLSSFRQDDNRKVPLYWA